MLRSKEQIAVLVLVVAICALLAFCIYDANAEILQPCACGEAQKPGYHWCHPCDKWTVPECPPVVDCTDTIAALAQRTSERDACAVALQNSYNKDKTQKACVAKTAKATSRRCFP